MRYSTILLVLMLAYAAHAQDSALPVDSVKSATERRALFNYQMFCQGCHAADGSGHKSVPQLKGFMHNFMSTQQGREYLIRVPGAANAALDDEQLTEVMNWMLRNFGDSSNGSNWQPFQVSEVSKYRKDPLNETVSYRAKLIASLKLESEL